MSVPVVVMLTAAALSALATWRWLRVAECLALTDPPNPLVTQHRDPVVTAGGLPAAVVATLMLVLAWSLPPNLIASRPDWPLLIVAAAFLALGVADDVLRLSARSKFLAQLVLAIAGAAAGITAPLTGMPVADFAITILVIVIVVNAVNLTDVCDGLVAGLLVAACLSVAIQRPETSLVPLVAAGAAAGFLVFNRPPARAFLGDAGTHWFGFVLAAALLQAAPGAALAGLAGLALIPGVFLLELALLIVARARRGVPPWIGSPDHLSLRLQAAGVPRWTVVIVASAAGAVLGAVAIVSRDWRGLEGLALAGVTAMLLAGALAWLLRLPAAPVRAVSDDAPRLLWIHQNYVTPRQAGNARPERILAALLDRGWVIDVVTTAAGYLEDGNRDRRGSRVTIERDGRHTIHRLRHRGGFRRVRASLSFCTLAALYLGQIRRVDVVFASTPPLPQILVAVLASLARRAPIVLEVRDLWPTLLIRAGLVRSRAAIACLRWMELAAYRIGRRCITVSPTMIDYLESCGVARNRLTVAPTGCTRIAVDASLARLRRQALGVADGFAVIYAGSFNEAYGLGRVLQAAALTASRAPDIVWVFAGDGRGRGQVEAAAASLPNVRFIGRLPGEEIRELLPACDLGLLPLMDDSVIQMALSGKLFDYFDAALPVLCLGDGIMGAIARRAKAGMVLPAATPQDVAAAVQAFARMDEKERRHAGERGRAWAWTHMPSSLSAAQVADVVEDVHRRHGSRSQLAFSLGACLTASRDLALRRAGRAEQGLIGQVDRDTGGYAEHVLDRWLGCGTAGTRG